MHSFITGAEDFQYSPLATLMVVVLLVTHLWDMEQLIENEDLFDFSNLLKTTLKIFLQTYSVDLTFLIVVEVTFDVWFIHSWTHTWIHVVNKWK